MTDRVCGNRIVLTSGRSPSQINTENRQLHRKPVSIDFMTVLMKQMTLVGAMEYPERYETMLELIARRDLTPMITHRYALDDFVEAFAVASSPDAGAKVMIHMR